MADDPKLIVSLEARLDRFEKQLKEAGLIAQKEVDAIEASLGSIGSKTAGGAFAGTFLGTAFADLIKEIPKALQDMIKQFDELGATMKRAAINAEELQRILFVTARAGISTTDAARDVEKVSAALEEMARKQTPLSRFLDDNNIKWRDQFGNVMNVNKALETAAQLMSKAATENEKIRIAEKFKLTKEWVEVLGDGVDAYKQLAGQAAIDPGFKEAIESAQQLRKEWNELLSELGKDVAAPVIHFMLTAFREIRDIFQGLKNDPDFREFLNLFGVPKPAPGMGIKLPDTGIPNIVIRKPSGVNWDSETRGVGNYKDALDRANDSLQKQLELTQAEIDALGQTVSVQEQKRQLALLTAAAQRAGLDPETAITEEMRKQAELAGIKKQQLVEQRAALQNLVDSSKEFGSALADGFKALVLEGKKFDEVLKSLINRLASKAIDKAFDLLFAPTPGGGLSTPLLSLFKGRMAGGPVTGGAPYIVGEKGPELFVPGQSGAIFPNTAARGMAGGMSFAPITNIDARGSSMSETQFRAILAVNNRQLLQTVSQSAPARQRRLEMLGT